MDKQLQYYRLAAKEVLRDLESRPQGLSPDEAHERLQHMGLNALPEHKKTPITFIFWRQFKNILVSLLILSSLIAFYLESYQTAIVLLLIALVNACIGFFQEHKAESLLESLNKLVVPHAKAQRGGILEEIAASELVVGDIVYIEEGDSVPADIRLIEENHLSSNDFALTGESNPSRKFVHAIDGDVPLASRHNLIFMGTTIATGSGYGVVIGTGAHTELGRVAGLSQSTSSDSSPLQKEMNHISKRLAQGVVILAGLLTILALLGAHFTFSASLLFGIAIATALIPSGLVAEVNFSLAQAAGRMARNRTLVKRLSAVETLGATNIIATDKTGTLTKNQMTVETFIIGREEYTTTRTGYEANGTILNTKGQRVARDTLKKMSIFFETASLANNARVNPPDDEHPTWHCIGDPTEGALITFARKAGFEPLELNEKNPEIREFQFDSNRKLMTSARKVGDKTILFVKGAPESIIARSVKLWDHGHVRRFTSADSEYYTNRAEKLAKNAKRNLALAYRVLSPGESIKRYTFENAEQDFVFLGMVSIVDPIRDEVPAAMEAARRAHIKVSIITGDHPVTAKAIAQKARLTAKKSDITIVNGAELQLLSETQIIRLLHKGGTVFSRVSPEDKLRIVELAKSDNYVVAVTGDGINDAPALKRADIGVAMGKSGTAVAQEAAGIVLLDDGFNTLIGAVEQGRLTYQNIKKAVRCALTDNAGELLLIIGSIIAGLLFDIPMAITAIQILAIDVIAQLAPISSLAWDPAQRELMNDKPRNTREHIINRHTLLEFIGYGSLAAGLAFANYLWFFERNNVSPANLATSSDIYMKATILTYLTVVLCQFMNLLLVRANKDELFFTSYLWSNKKLLMAFAFSFFCIINIIYNPVVQPYFGASSLGFIDWLYAVLAALIYLAIRLIHKHSRKHTRSAVLVRHRAHYAKHNSLVIPGKRTKHATDTR